jgi:hypothetical protein
MISRKTFKTGEYGLSYKYNVRVYGDKYKHIAKITTMGTYPRELYFYTRCELVEFLYNETSPYHADKIIQYFDDKRGSQCK